MKIATLLLLATGFLTAVLGRVSEHIHPEHSAPSKRNARSLSRSLSTPADALLGNSTSSPGFSTLVARALFDANNVATDAMFEKHRAKGHFQGCLLVATDEAAERGGLIHMAEHPSRPRAYGLVPCRVSNPIMHVVLNVNG
jgi:hypothetical protein